MKYILRIFIFNVFAIWMISQIFPGLIINGDWRVLFFAGFIFSILMVFIKPLLKILFIPINILTFGLLSWSINVILLYLLTILVPEVMVSEFTFPGLTYSGFVIPKIIFNYVLTLVTASLGITFLSNLLNNISENK